MSLNALKLQPLPTIAFDYPGGVNSSEHGTEPDRCNFYQKAQVQTKTTDVMFHLRDGRMADLEFAGIYNSRTRVFCELLETVIVV